MKHIEFLFLFLFAIVQVCAAQDAIRNNVLVNGTKYQYQSYIEIKEGKFIPLFGMGLMMVPEGQPPLGLVGSVAAIFSSGYQAKAKLGQTGPQEVLIAKHIRKSLGGGSRIASEIVDKSKLKAPLDEQ